MCEREWVSEGEGERLSEGVGPRECGEHQVRERARERECEQVRRRVRERARDRERESVI